MESDVWAPLDVAIGAYLEGDVSALVVMRTDVGGEEEVPVRLFFREPGEMVQLERTALDLCRGRVLDVGAGVGAMSVPLTARGMEVVATEVLPRALAVLRERGVPALDPADPNGISGAGLFDTVLLMMNGLGLAGTLESLPPFLEELVALLAPGGQILTDSTDPTAWEEGDDGRAPGEVHMQLGYGGSWGDPFPFLFVSPGELTARGEAAGLSVDVVAREADGRYLARLRRRGSTP